MKLNVEIHKMESLLMPRMIVELVLSIYIWLGLVCFAILFNIHLRVPSGLSKGCVASLLMAIAVYRESLPVRQFKPHIMGLTFPKISVR